MVGRHKWELRIDHGDEFKVCALCGKSPRKVSGGPKGSGFMDGADTSYGGGGGGGV